MVKTLLKQRPLTCDIAEIKRVYARTKKAGIGKKIVNSLEKIAKDFGYCSIYLETRLINQNAVMFYKELGYTIIPNYGKYVNRPEAACFGKSI